jgi:hypothetical protein
MDNRICVFPQLPLNNDQFDTRTFAPGEEVCLRNDLPRTGAVRGRYTRPHPQPGTGRVFIHIVDNRWLRWPNVGKLVPPPLVSPTAVEVVGRNVEVKIPTKQNLGRGVVQTTETTRQLPEDVERLIKTFGGKTRRSRGRRRKTQKPPRRRSTR